MSELSNPGFVTDPAGSLAGLGSIMCVQSLILGVKLSHQEEGRAGKGPPVMIIIPLGGKQQFTLMRERGNFDVTVG